MTVPLSHKDAAKPHRTIVFWSDHKFKCVAGLRKRRRRGQLGPSGPSQRFGSLRQVSPAGKIPQPEFQPAVAFDPYRGANRSRGGGRQWEDYCWRDGRARCSGNHLWNMDQLKCGQRGGRVVSGDDFIRRVDPPVAVVIVTKIDRRLARRTRVVPSGDSVRRIQLRSNKRTCAGLVALSSSERSSLTAAASPPLSVFPLSDTSPSAT